MVSTITLRHFLIWGTMGMLTAVLGACATSSVTGSWKDDSYRGKLSNVLVVALANEETSKRVFEDTMARSLSTKGVSATPGNKVFSGAGQLDKSTVAPVLRDKGFDGVLVARLVNVDKESRYVPGTPRPAGPHNRNFYGYYGSAYPVVHDPGYVVNDTIVSLEFNLYDAASESLIWTMTSETFNPAEMSKESQAIAELIVDKLSKDGVI